MIGYRSHFPLLALLAALLLGSCGGGGSGGAERSTPLVVVSTTILGDVVANLVGDDAAVEVLIPPGVDPHDFEPSARQAASLREADLVVVNGLGLEIGLASTVESARSDGAVVVAVADMIDPLPFDLADQGHDHGHDGRDREGAEAQNHSHDGHDPHFWHDPTRMAQAVPALAAVLADAMPELGPAGVSERADDLVADLMALDAEVEAILAPIPSERRLLLTNHHTLGYFAHRYDFEVIGAVIAGGDTMASPSASELASLVQVIEAHEVPAIFAEVVSSRVLADTLAAEVGFSVEVVQLYTDALGSPDSDAPTYAAMLLTNARRVAEALL